MKVANINYFTLIYLHKILQCGVDGNVDFIITGDNDLLVLGEYMNIKIKRSKEYLEIIEGT
jgi:predicted nucleic acid-binding protein